jgi:hypothetical protein
MPPLPTLPLAIALNSEPVKYMILALTAPLWIPFFKALWHTLNDGLREEGGLLGRPPTAEQLLEMEQKFGPAAATLISVPKDGPVVAGGRQIASSERDAGPTRDRGGRERGPRERAGRTARAEGTERGRGPGPRRFR